MHCYLIHIALLRGLFTFRYPLLYAIRYFVLCIRKILHRPDIYGFNLYCSRAVCRYHSMIHKLQCFRKILFQVFFPFTDLFVCVPPGMIYPCKILYITLQGICIFQFFLDHSLFFNRDRINRCEIIINSQDNADCK